MRCASLESGTETVCWKRMAPFASKSSGWLRAVNFKGRIGSSIDENLYLVDVYPRIRLDAQIESVYAARSCESARVGTVFAAHFEEGAIGDHHAAGLRIANHFMDVYRRRFVRRAWHVRPPAADAVSKHAVCVRYCNAPKSQTLIEHLQPVKRPVGAAVRSCLPRLVQQRWARARGSLYSQTSAASIR